MDAITPQQLQSIQSAAQRVEQAAQKVKFNQDNFFKRVHKEPSDIQYSKTSFQSKVDAYSSGYGTTETQATEIALAREKSDNKKGFSLGLLGDVLDVVNPLQHIPVVSHVYRQVSGDNIRGLARVAGGALYGGPVGAASSAVNAVVESQTGKDVAGHIFAFDGQSGTATAKKVPNYQEMTAKYTHQQQSHYND